MNQVKSLVLILLCALLASTVVAQQRQQIELQKLTDNIYKISASDDYEVNFVASVGKDGILLIDTGFKATAQELRVKLDSLGAGPVRYVVNTHAHVDHTGGNALFGKKATIIGQKEMRRRLMKGAYVLEEYPDEAFPVITFDDNISLFFNGEEVKVIALPGSHSSTDSIVIFTKSKVAYLGDLAYGNKFPSTSLFQGSPARYAEIVRKAMEFLSEDFTVVSGHGDNCSMAQMREYLEMLEETTNLVKEGLAQGKDVVTLEKDKIFSKWEEKGYGDYYVSADLWIESLARSLNPKPKNREPIVEPLYYAFREKGIDGLKSRYFDLKTNHFEEYEFNATVFYVIGSYIIQKELLDEAIEFYKFMTKEYPDSWIISYGLGEAYLTADHKDLAINCFKRVLELDPENMYAIDMLEQYDPTYNERK